MKLYRIDGLTAESVSSKDNRPKAPFGKPTPRIRVLLVEDVSRVCRLPVRTLDSRRFKVDCAVGIDDAVRLATLLLPNAILLDMEVLPDHSADGIACLRALRQNRYGGPIYIVSDNGSTDRVQAAVKYGAHGYLKKCASPSFRPQLERILGDAAAEIPIPVRHLCRPAVAFLESSGLSKQSILLLDAYMDGCERATDIARITGRKAPAVRKNFQRIRIKLGVRNQIELAYFLGLLSCFTEPLPAKKIPILQ